jgi:hypothetical protein
VADQDVSSFNFDGGSASNTSFNQTVAGGSAGFALSPTEGGTAAFVTQYTNIALTKEQFPRINATFKDFNDQPEVRFIKESFRVVQKADTLDTVNLADFFHPLQNFSDFQKQTFNIGPHNSANLDPSSFDSTLGEVSFIIARANYLPEAGVNERILFWDYKNTGRNTMGQFMVLTGAVKNGLSWKGWNVDPFSTYDHNGPANITAGGFTFTNPTQWTVKLTIITAN